MYPGGLSLFYDMNSLAGYIGFMWDWSIFMLWLIISPITLFIPVEVWAMIVDGTTDWLYVFALYYLWPLMLPICYVFPCPLEEGWNMFSL